MKPAINIYIDRTEDKYVAIFPKGLRDMVDIDFIEADDPDYPGLKARGIEHPAAERDRLMLDPANDFIEFV